MADRMRRVNTLIQQQLGRILTSELELPRDCIVTVAKVETSRDLHRARVWISVLPAERFETILRLIKDHHGEIQRALGEVLEIRYVPKMTFLNDPSEEHAAGINHLIDSIAEGD